MDTRKELRLDEKSTTLAIEGKVECKGAELLPCSTILSHPFSPPPPPPTAYMRAVWKTFLSAVRTLTSLPDGCAGIGDVG